MSDDQRVSGGRRDGAGARRSRRIEPTLVACRNHHRDAVHPGVFDGPAQRIERRDFVYRAPEGKVDHLDIPFRMQILECHRAVDRQDHLAVGRRTGAVQHLEADQFDAGGNAMNIVIGAQRIDSPARNQARHVRAVSVMIDSIGVAGEILRVDHEELQVIVDVDTAVDNDDADAESLERGVVDIGIRLDRLRHEVVRAIVAL